MMYRSLGLIIITIAAIQSAEIVTADGTRIAYEQITCNPKMPRLAFGVRTESGLKSYKLSEIDHSSLPTEMQEKIAAYTAERLEAGEVLHDNEWVNRNELLLRSDERFSYKRKLRRQGTNLFTLKNQGDTETTIGLRNGSYGYEISAGGSAEDTVRHLPDGTYQMLVATVTEDDTAIVVESMAKPITLKHTHYTLTTGLDKGEKGKFVGMIVIPEEMRRKR
jgi:hypothetical protein